MNTQHHPLNKNSDYENFECAKGHISTLQKTYGFKELLNRKFKRLFFLSIHHLSLSNKNLAEKASISKKNETFQPIIL